MDLPSLVVFASALFVAAASPGPGIAAIVARVLVRGPTGALAFTSGIAFGDLVWLTVAITGLAALAQTFHGVFLVVRWAGAAYLLWLAWRLWTAPAATLDEPPGALPSGATERSWRLFTGGLAVTLGNPKVMVFYLALLPSLIDMRAIDMLAYLELVAIVTAVLAVVFGGWIALAARARRLFRSPRAVRRANRAAAGIMAGAAATIVAR